VQFGRDASTLDIDCCQAAKPDRYRSGLSNDVTGRKDLGPETTFRQPDYFVAMTC
jgi:hypothetical protein